MFVGNAEKTKKLKKMSKKKHPISQRAPIHIQLPLAPFEAANIYSGIYTGHSVENRLQFIDGQIYCILRYDIHGRQ